MWCSYGIQAVKYSLNAFSMLTRQTLGIASQEKALQSLVRKIFNHG